MKVHALEVWTSAHELTEHSVDVASESQMPCASVLSLCQLIASPSVAHWCVGGDAILCRLWATSIVDRHACAPASHFERQRCALVAHGASGHQPRRCMSYFASS